MQSWWDALNATEKLFWFIAIPFSIIFVIQMVLAFIGIGGGATDPGADMPDMHTDLGSNGHDVTHSNQDSGPAFSFFTVRNFIAFFTVFSWSGLAFTHSGCSLTSTILLSLLIGLIAMLLISSLFYFAMKMTSSGNISVQNAIGATGKVYLPIKANKSGIGKVQVTFQGSVREMQAITTENTDLPTNTIIRVAAIADENILIVEKI